MTNVLRLPNATPADDIIDGTDVSSAALEQATARQEFETKHRDFVVALAENFDKPAGTQTEICQPSKSVLRSFALVRMFDRPAFDAAIEKIRSAPPVKSFNIESFLRAIESIARRLSSIEDEIQADIVSKMSPTRRKEWQAAEAERIARELKFIIHGTVGSNFCYSSDQSDLVFLSPREHNKNNLFNLAPKAYWEMNFGDYDGHKFVIDWDTVYSSLMMQAHQRGPVRMAVPRGRGAFEEDGSLVFNTGRELIFETGYRAPIHEHTASEFLYKRGVEIVVSDTPLDAARRKLMIDILEEFTWQARHHAVLLLGWVVMSIISGTLPFRTMAWLTAVAGSGKSTLLQQIVRQVFSESTEGYFLGTTTIHGIASAIGNDSVPFIYDEAETGTERARERMTAFLTEIRGVISKSTAQRSVGSSDGSGRSTKLNATCLVASIADCIVDPADAQRVLRLKLQKPRFTNNEARQKAASFERRVAETFTPEFSADFYAFAILNYRAIRNSIDAFAEYFFSDFRGATPDETI